MTTSPHTKTKLKSLKAKLRGEAAMSRTTKKLARCDAHGEVTGASRVEPSALTGCHSEHASSSNNPRAAGSLPTALSAGLPNIPRTPSGIIDTIIVDLDAPIHKRDVERLSKLTEWTVTERGAGMRARAGEKVKDLRALVLLWRESDGCRVTCFSDRTRVEVSLPRVLGYSNHRQAWLSELDALEALQLVTSKLLPLTTKRARWQRAAEWHIERMDLAKNFLGRAANVIESTRLAKHPSIRSLPTVSGQDGLAIYGTNCELCIYEMDAKLGRGSLSKTVRGKQLKRESARREKGLSRLRFEFRYLTDVGLDRLTKHLNPSPSGLPFMVTGAGGVRRVVRLGFTNHLLHQILASEALALGSVSALQADGVKSWKGLGLLGRLYLIEHPEAWSEMDASYGERSLRQFRQEIAALQLTRTEQSLVGMIWFGPQITPVQRQRFKARQEALRRKLTNVV